MKKFITAGLLVWLPLIVTAFILEAIVDYSDRLVTALPAGWQPAEKLGFDIPGLGLAIAFAIVFLTGIVTANFIGRKLVHWWESLLEAIPVVRPIYSGVKQIAHTLLNQEKNSFQEVVLVQFPQAGQWTYGFVVSRPGPSLAAEIEPGKTDGEWVTVYIPTAPNPTSGYVLMANTKDLRKTSISVDDAFKFHVSLGVLLPACSEKQSGAPEKNGTSDKTKA